MVKESYCIAMDRPWQAKPVKRDRPEERIRITTACRDRDDLPRVPDPGRCMVDENGNAVPADRGLDGRGAGAGA